MPVPTATNDNALEGIACPACRAQDSFSISVVATAAVIDDGTDTFVDPQWTDGSAITCDACAHTGTVGEFSVEPGDLLLRDEEVSSLLSQAAYGIHHWAAEAAHDRDKRTFFVTESAAELDDDEVPETRTFDYVEVRRVFSQLWRSGGLPEFMDQEIADDDLDFDPEVGDRVVQQIVFGELVYG